MTLRCSERNDKMKHVLKDCRNGGEAVYKTELEIWEKDERLYFKFRAEHTQYYCPYDHYNDIHSEGDACEILIGSDPKRQLYYEIEISPKNCLMLAKMQYCGDDDQGNPVLKIDFIKDCFLSSRVTLFDGGYEAEISFDKKDIMTGEGEIYFNAYRLETDGGEMEKHLFALIPTMKGKFHVPTKYDYLKKYCEIL